MPEIKPFTAGKLALWGQIWAQKRGNLLNVNISQIVAFKGKPWGFLLFGENFWVILNFGMRPLLVEYGKIKWKNVHF